MAKKCTICEEQAEFAIKDTSDFYCKDCAVQQFGDLQLLVAIEDRVKEIKNQMDEFLAREEEKK